MVSKERLRQIANETIEISESGKYIIPGSDKQISFIQETTTKLYRANQLRVIDDRLSRIKRDSTCVCYVEERDTISEILRETDKSSNLRIGVLVFASAHSPGGGFRNGSMAQEESIAYCSNLYACQTDFIGQAYYDTHETVRNPIYTNTMLVSPITIFRDSNFNLIEYPVRVTAITSPAVNRGIGISKKMNPNTLDQEMYIRMRYILDLFVESGCEDLILGAYGCGVFKNNPITIANNWYKLLFNENMGRFFNKVTFAVIGSEFIKAFKTTFRGF